MKCDEQVVPLVKSLTNEVNKNEGRGTKIALEAINECEREKSDIHSQFESSQFEFVLQFYWCCGCYIYC